MNCRFNCQCYDGDRTCAREKEQRKYLYVMMVEYSEQGTEKNSESSELHCGGDTNHNQMTESQYHSFILSIPRTSSYQ